jgi:hypothetical protein
VAAEVLFHLVAHFMSNSRAPREEARSLASYDGRHVGPSCQPPGGEDDD